MHARTWNATHPAVCTLASCRPSLSTQGRAQHSPCPTSRPADLQTRLYSDHLLPSLDPFHSRSASVAPPSGFRVHSSHGENSSPPSFLLTIPPGLPRPGAQPAPRAVGGTRVCSLPLRAVRHPHACTCHPSVTGPPPPLCQASLGASPPAGLMNAAQGPSRP